MAQAGWLWWQIFTEQVWMGQPTTMSSSLLRTGGHWKGIKQSVEKLVSRARGKDLKIPIGNLELLCDHPEGWNKFQDHYKSKLYIVDLKHWDPNVYKIKPLCGKGPMCMVNWWQLFHLQKSPGAICYIQPWIPICLLCWCRNCQRSL